MRAHCSRLKYWTDLVALLNHSLWEAFAVLCPSPFVAIMEYLVTGQLFVQDFALPGAEGHRMLLGFPTRGK